MKPIDPKDFIITRKRKKYKFALFHNSPLCYEVEQWKNAPRPTSIEVGAGSGYFSVVRAEKLPGEEHLAIDIKGDRLQRGARMAFEHRLSNIRFLRARIDQLPSLLDVHSLEAIWLTFPDPFPKQRSAKHRLTHPYFLAIYAQLLSAKGRLYFKTDAIALFEWSLEQLAHEGWHIKELSFDLHTSELPESYKILTTYETRFINEGLRIHFVEATPPQ